MVSIIVLSSDGYSDCWKPFFYLLNKNFPEANNHEIILSTNTKTFLYEGLDIKCLTHGEKTPWSRRLLSSLNYATNDIVMVMVEDFFIFSKLNQKIFYNLLSQIKNIDKIDHIRLLYNKDKINLESSEFEFLDRIKLKSKNRFLYLPGLWKTSVLKKYVVDFETPYMSEKMSNLRSYVLKDGFYAISIDFVKEHGPLYNCATSGGIIKGKWDNWIIEVFEENNIHIDYNIRGIRDRNNQKNSKINQIYKNYVANPINTVRSFLSIMKLFFYRT